MIDRWILALPERSAADRLAVGDVLGAAEGAERTYSLPKRVAGAKRPRPDHGASLLIVSIGHDGEAPTPLRLAEVLAVSIDGSSGSIKTRIGKLVGTASLGLARSYLTRGGALVPGLHASAPPMPPSQDPDSDWVRLVDLVTESAPDTYGDVCFLRVTEETLSSMTVRCRAASGATPEGSLAAVDAAGRSLAVQPLADRMVLAVPPDAVARIELRSESATGYLTMPARTVSADRGGPIILQPVIQSASGPSRQWTPGIAHELLDHVRQMTKSPRQVAELARLLTKADPEDDDLRFIEGRAWLAEGDVQAARRAIGSVPLARRSGVAEAALLVAELRDGHFDQSEDRYMRADFDGTLFQEFCEAIIGLDTPQRARAIAWLMTVLDTNRAAALITSAKSAVPAGPSLTAIASRLSDHAPTDAARLLESACPLQELDTEALTLLVDLRQRLEQGAVADPLALLVDRLISGGDRDEAIQRVEELQGQLHWGDLQAILQPLIQSIAADGSDWDMDRTIAALTVATMAAGAVRQELAVDPASAMDTYVRLRASFGTGSPEVNAVLDDLSLTLEDAWEATETHRNALAEAETSMIPRIRDRWSGKRLLIVGGRRPVWFSDVSDAVGFHDRTAWFESSPNQRPSQERLRQLVQAGRIDLLVIIVDYIGHSTSEIKSFAQERGFQTADAKSGRLSFLRALVEAR